MTVTQVTDKTFPKAHKQFAKVLASLWIDGHEKKVIESIKKNPECRKVFSELEAVAV